MLKTLKTFFRFETQRQALYGTFIFLVVLSTGLRSAIPYFYKLFIDILPSKDFAQLTLLVVSYFLLRLFALILATLSYYLGDSITFEGSKNARIQVFNHLHDLDFAFHSEKSTGSLISAIKRGDGAFFSLHHAFHHRILEVGVSFVVMVVFLTALNPTITVIVIASFLACLILTKFLVANNVRKRSAFNEEEDHISSIITDNIINFDTVKFFAKEKWESARLTKDFKKWTQTLWGYGNSFRLFDIGVGGLVNVSIFIILLLALNYFHLEAIGLAEFVLIFGFINSFFPYLWDLVWGFRDIAKNYADIEKYFRILDYEVSVKDPQTPVDLATIKGEINFDAVSFAYLKGNRNALKNFSLKVRQGQSVALVGRSGSGKTTVVKLLMRFYDPQKGSISIDKTDIRKLTKSKLRSYIGVVPQEPILFNNTIAYNIGYGKVNQSLKEIKAAAKIANISGFIESLPHKYETNVGERGIKLSGGQKQRLAIARMILSDPEIIIFDEATSQLDSESERLIQDAFWHVTANKTTIIIAHRLSTVMKADKIVVMDNGRIVEVGSHRELVTRKNSLYTKFWNLQIKL
ncbi:MAG: hypothetical protein ACD_52C00156G0002 [uncultured bacterium]|nr:MAG: hypothetical protein ACD_52C00156G0002 [uncultured bacterium]